MTTLRRAIRVKIPVDHYTRQNGTSPPDLHRSDSLPSLTSPSDPISPWPLTSVDQGSQRAGSGKTADDTDLEPNHPSQKSINGLLAVCTTYAGFALYLLWALLPEYVLQRIGLDWLPDQ